MNLTRRAYVTRSEKTKDFVIGLMGWILLNLVVVWVGHMLAAWVPSNLLIVVINLGLLIYFGLTRHWIALGALLACVVCVLLALGGPLLFRLACANSTSYACRFAR